MIVSAGLEQTLCSFVAKYGSTQLMWKHQQQQACNTIRGYWFCTTGLRPVTPRLVVETAFGRFAWDSEFGLVFYSYLSIGTLNLNLKFRPPARLPGLCYTASPTFALRRKGRLSVFGALLHQLADLAPSSQRTALSVDDLFPLG